MYFSNPFGMTLIFTLNLLNSLNINDCHILLNYEILQELFW